MNCPACQSPMQRVTDTLKFPTVHIRKLVCRHCRYEFGTLEMRSEMEALLVELSRITKEHYKGKVLCSPPSPEPVDQGDCEA